MSADHHDHATVDRRRLAIALGITAGIVLVQLVGAIMTGSLALLVDAAHMLTDAGGLLIALIAARLMQRPVSSTRTWGLARAEVLGATLQAAVLLGVGLYVLIEGAQRLIDPPEIAPLELIIFGAIGLAANLVAIAVLSGGRRRNLNMRAAFLEVMADALGSVAVIVAAAVIALTGWLQADAVAAIVIGALIVPRSLRLLRESLDVLLESVPRGIDLDDVRRHIAEVPHVVDVHDLHISQIATGRPVLTAHVVVDDECFHDGHASEITEQLQTCVAEHFAVAIDHSTFQLEPASAAARHALH